MQEQNKFQPTSIADKVRLIRKMHERSTNNDWTMTTKSVLAVLGEQKRSTVLRWISLARDLLPEVLDHIKASDVFSSALLCLCSSPCCVLLLGLCRCAMRRRIPVTPSALHVAVDLESCFGPRSQLLPTFVFPQGRRALPQALVLGNKFMIGRGEELRFKLSPRYARAAFDLLFEKVDTGLTIASAEFASEFCLPMKHVETWEKAQVKIFGACASTFPAFARVINSLQTEAGRQKVLVCLRDRVPLSGRLTGQGTHTAGVEECRAVVAEMQKMKAGEVPAGQGGSASSPAVADGLPQDEANPDRRRC